jgi:hypothetical protein
MYTVEQHISMSSTEKHGKWEMHSVDHGIWETYKENHGKWETLSIEHGI